MQDSVLPQGCGGSVAPTSPSPSLSHPLSSVVPNDGGAPRTPEYSLAEDTGIIPSIPSISYPFYRFKIAYAGWSIFRKFCRFFAC